MAPNDPWKSTLGAIATAALHVLALPITLVLSIRSLGKIVRTICQLREGTIVCRFCGMANPLAMMTRCPACGAVEPGSRLRCSFCNNVYQVISCSGCGATLRML
jgi:hypothetical protein